MKEKGYGIVTKQVMRDKRLCVAEKALFSYLCTYAGNKDYCYPSRRLISYELGITEASVTKYIRKLMSCGYLIISKMRNGSGKFANNVYRLKRFNENSSDSEKAVNFFNDTADVGQTYCGETEDGAASGGEISPNNNNNKNNKEKNNKEKNNKYKNNIKKKARNNSAIVNNMRISASETIKKREYKDNSSDIFSYSKPASLSSGFGEIRLDRLFNGEEHDGMTKEETDILLRQLCTIYPWKNKEFSSLLSVWSDAFSTTPAQEVYSAVIDYIKSDDKGYMPLPGKINEIIARRKKENEYSITEHMFMKAYESV